MSELEDLLEKFRSEFKDENSEAFKKILKNSNLENEIVNIPYYVSNYESFWDIQNDKNTLKHYCFIDKNIYERVKKILPNVKNIKTVNEISSILKKAYYKTFVAKINTEIRKKMAEFTRAYTSFVSYLQKDIVELNIKGENTGDYIKIKNRKLIELIHSLFIDKFINDPFVIDYISDTSNSTYLKTFDISELYISIAILDLLHYIILNELVEKHDTNKHLEYKYSNKHLKLVYDLLTCASLINEETKTSPEKDFLRTRIKNYLNKINLAKLITVEDNKRFNIKVRDSFENIIESVLSDTIK